MRDNVKGGALTEVTFLLLLAFYTPRHGYGVMQFVREKTNGRLQLGAGTLYGAIRTLLEKGWIEPFGTSSGRKKEYVISASGKQAAQKEKDRLERLLGICGMVFKEDGCRKEGLAGMDGMVFKEDGCREEGLVGMDGMGFKEGGCRKEGLAGMDGMAYKEGGCRKEGLAGMDGMAYKEGGCEEEGLPEISGMVFQGGGCGEEV